jgi:adenine-specific DNA-methyltransferase
MNNRLDMLYLPARASTQTIVAALQVEVARRMVKLFVGPRLSWPQGAACSQHGMDWTDRLIVGDSRIIMNSALGCDLLAGKVQMIYLDPPDPTGEADLLRCRGLLHDSGGMFLRISDDDPPGLRNVMDSVFGPDNCRGIVTLEDTSAQAIDLLPSFAGHPIWYRKPVADYLVWYSRDPSRVDSQQLLVLRHFCAQYPNIFGAGRERRKRCGLLLR